MLRAIFLLMMTASAAAQSTADWATHAERTEYRETPRYEQSIAYFRRLAQAAPRQVRMEEFGRTPEGRALHIVIVSKDGVFDPQKIRAANRPIVLIQNAIHAGEMDGKDASMALLREIVITKKLAHLIERTVLVVIPIYNADGHERFGPHNRINQNGPEQMGWRTTAQNLNLNRDYMKADAPETRAFLKLFNRWLPDYFVDNHVTNGADYQYDVTLGMDSGPDVSPEIARWQRESVWPHVLKTVDANGHISGPYVDLINPNDPTKGLSTAQDVPRLATGYMIVQNRPATLVEMHMMKDYRTRVTGNYWTMVGLLEVIARDADKLVAMTRAADRAQIAGRAPVALRLEASGATEPFEFKGFRWTIEPSGVSGAPWIRYDDTAPVTVTLPRQNELKVTSSVEPAAAYIVPPQWTEAISVLEAHGLEMRRTKKEMTATVPMYRCSGMRWQERPFESRHMVNWTGTNPPTCTLAAEQFTFPAGSVIVPTAQRAGKVAVHLLEPHGPDSLVTWGFFTSVFEQKEYAEPYVAEKLARQMMERDPKLRAEFEEKVANDKEFAKNPRARLDFFYRRSPYWDQRFGLYPVGRLEKVPE